MHTPRRKDLLLRVLRKMKAVHGSVYDFHPDSYMLPTEYTKFISEFTRLQQQKQQQQKQMHKGQHGQKHQDHDDHYQDQQHQASDMSSKGGGESLDD